MLRAADEDKGQGGQPIVAPEQHGQGTVALKAMGQTRIILGGGIDYRFHGFQGEQGQLQLLHRIAFLVADE